MIKVWLYISFAFADDEKCTILHFGVAMNYLGSWATDDWSHEAIVIGIVLTPKAEYTLNHTSEC